MLCISRHTDDTYAQHFGDGRHKFYLEFRCNRPCLKTMECCAKCAEKSDSTKLQHSRKFNHGNVNEPIPDNSHIFGGKWYYDGCQKWGAPPSEIMEFALQYQKEARGNFVVEQPDYSELSKAKKESTPQEMPRAKKIENTESSDAVAAPVKRGRKPKVAPESVATTEEVVAEVKPKQTRKPKVAPETPTEAPKKRAPRKKAEETPYTSLIQSTNVMVHKEATLPTHLETSLDKIDAEGYTIEYIKLVPFEVGAATYFRDTTKNKLYKKIKEKGIGVYVGRWNPDTDCIVSDIPDSDDEN